MFYCNIIGLIYDVFNAFSNSVFFHNFCVLQNFNMLHSCLCVTCSQPVNSEIIYLFCSLCLNRVHIECIPNFSLNDFEKLTEIEKSSWYCHVCIGQTLPFNMCSANADFYDAIIPFSILKQTKKTKKNSLIHLSNQILVMEKVT